MNENYLQELQAIVGTEGFISSEESIDPFLQERRGLYRGHCSAVIRPGSTEEVSEVVKCCKKNNVPITPQSGNTGLCGGAVPQGGILINMGRMNRIRDFDPVNSTITAESGCVQFDLQAAARERELMMTLSCPAQKECQLGGNLSTNLGGLNVLRYGNTRDLVLGLEVVLPSGEIWHGLRGLRKDNAGYDLKHLFIGAEGTLGIITAATLKLFPFPKTRLTAIVAMAEVEDLMEVFIGTREHFADNLVGFEIIPRIAVEMVLQYDDNICEPFPSRHNWYGLIELNATNQGLDLKTPMTDFLRTFPHDSKIAANESESDALWAIRHAIPEAQKIRGASIKHDVSLPINKMSTFLTEAAKQVKARLPGILVCSFGHAGDGNVHFNLTQPEKMENQEFNNLHQEFNRIVHDLVHQMNGSIAAEHGVGQLKYEELRKYTDPVEYEMMRMIKRTFDPQNLFNPGKVIKLDG